MKMRYIPNILSCFRIILIPFLVWQLIEGNTSAAGIILIISALTDLFDGKLARRFGWVTDVGKVLDPIADKLTQVILCIALAFRLREYWYLFIIMPVKDFVMLVLGGYLLKKGVHLEGAKWFGKVSTTVFYAAMAAIVLIPTMPGWIIVSLLVLATSCAVIAALMYIPEFNRYKRSVEMQHSSGGLSDGRQDPKKS